MKSDSPGWRAARLVPAAIWMAIIFWLSSQKALPPPPGLSYTLAAIAGHFLLYFVLTGLLLVAVSGPGSPSPRGLILAALIAIGYAVSDEFHQSRVPGRDASAFDVMVDAAGIAAMIVIWTYSWRKIAIS